MIGTFRVQRRPAADLARSARRGEPLHRGRPAPFKLVKTDLDACKDVLVNLAEAIRVVAILIKPFLPRTAETFYRAFNFEQSQPWDHVGFADVPAAVPPAPTGT